MAEVINFLDKAKKRKTISNSNITPISSKDLEDEDGDILNAKIVSKDVFFNTMMLLEDLGYDVNEDPDMIKDLEGLSFLAAGIVFRAHGNDHPGHRLLMSAYERLTFLAELYDQEENENEEDDSKECTCEGVPGKCKCDDLEKDDA
jgi:hypothetical protein